MKKIILLVLVSALLLVIFTACGQEEETDQSEDAISQATDYTPLIASAVQVVRGPLRDQVHTSGIIRGQQEVVLRSRVGGSIKQVHFELGERLVTQEVLVELEDRVASLRVSQLTQQYESARKELSSSEQLYERGSLSLAELTRDRAALDGLEAQLEQAKDALKDTRIATPIPGSVAEKGVGLTAGNMVQPGDLIARVVDLSELRVAVSVGQDQLFLVKKGFRAKVNIPTPYGTISTNGTVTAVSAGSDERTGSWRVLVDFPNPRPDTVKGGLSAEVIITNEDAKVFTLVPTAALVRREGKTYVFVVRDSKAEIEEVVLLDEYGNQAAVVSMDPQVELLEHKVLVSGLTRVRDGDDTVIEPYQQY
ncbi:MAG: efflux RND transporter periplasmic adaptor subunit [Spirochaetota bacterium]